MPGTGCRGSMPSYRHHVMFGVAVSLAAYLMYLHYRNLSLLDLRFLYYVPAIFIYSQLPDIDHPNSIIRRILTVMALAAIVFLMASYVFVKQEIMLMVAVALGAMLLLVMFLSHRGITHTILAALVLSAPLLLFDAMLPALCFVAYISHLVFDGKISMLS